MKIIRIAFVAAMMLAMLPAAAQFNLGKAVSAGKKAAQALTLSDSQMTQYVKEYIDWMDTNNKVSDADSPYTKRLDSLTAGLTSADGIPLNFKVYEVIDVNAFACPDGSVRVFSSLMDIMTDDELLGVIGHEIGHVAKHHSKDAMKKALLTSALKDAVGATGGKAAALTDGQLGSLAESLSSAKFSQKNEYEADNYGYDFLKSHGRNPRAMQKAFSKLLEMQGDQKSGFGDKVNQLFSTHPDLKKRIESVEKRCQQDGY